MSSYRTRVVDVFALLCLLHRVCAHSWLHCADYDDTAKTCRGWPRNFYKQPAMPLGQDMGRDVRPQADVPAGLICDAQKEGIQTPVTAGYNAQYPMTKLALGQQFMQTWPAKNHADVGTQRGVQLFISKTANGGDDFSHITSKAAWLQKYPKLTYTFSECNPPGPQVDRAECKGKYEVPTDLTPGVYTFMWWWEFNGGEFYNSCFDVEVTAAAATTGTATTGTATTGTATTGTATTGTAATGTGTAGTATTGTATTGTATGMVPCPAPSSGTGGTGQTSGSYNPMPTTGTGGTTGATGTGGATGATAATAATGMSGGSGMGGVGVAAGAPSRYSLTCALLTLFFAAIYCQIL